MSFKEVKQLRKDGDLDQALQQAKKDLETNPNDIWNKRSLSWVLYDYIKLNTDEKKFKEFYKYLIQIKELELPKEETMLFDNLAYQIAKMIFSMQKLELVNYKKIDKIFNEIKDFHFSKPSESYSVLFKSFLKGHQGWSRFIEFTDWWDLTNLRPEDYHKTEISKGKTIISLAEQTYVAYSKKLLATDKDGIKINEFLPKLDLIIIEHPEYQYTLYYKAKLLLSLGRNEEALTSFLPFARKKQNEFWVWELMSDLFTADDPEKLACLCKAVSLKSPPDFLVKTREKLASLLVEKGMYENAIPEIIKIIIIRKEKKWSFSGEIVHWTNQPWFIGDKIELDNSDFYKEHTHLAEDLLFQDIPEEIVAVEFVNTNKKILNFVKDQNKRGFFRYTGHINNPKIGDVLKIRFNTNDKDGFYKVFSVKKGEKSDTSESIKNFSGKISISEGKSFGFVNNIFINPILISNNNLKDNQTINGIAVHSFNKKKNQWGWKAFKIAT